MELDAVIQALRNNPAGVRFQELARYCDCFFGEPRQREAVIGCIEPRGTVTRE